MTTTPAKRLIDFREFANRLGGRSVRTVERLYEAGIPGLPKIVRLNRIKLVSEAEVDRFITALMRDKALPTAGKRVTLRL